MYHQSGVAMLAMLKRASLILKIFLPLAFVILLGVVVSLVLLTGSRKSEQFLLQLYEDVMQASLHLSDLDRLFTEHHMLLLEHISTEVAGDMRFLSADIDEVITSVDRVLKMHSQEHSRKHLESSVQLQELYEKYQEKSVEIIGLSRDFEKEKAFNILQSEAAPLLRQINSIIYDQRFAADKMMGKYYRQVDRSQKTYAVIAWCFVFISIVIPALMAFLLARYLSLHMNAIIVYAREIGKGNLEATLAVTADDEFGKLGNSLLTMGGDLSSYFKKLQAANLQLEAQTAALEKSETQLRNRQQELELSNKSLEKIQSTFNNLLLMALGDLPLDDLLQRFIQLISSMPELNLSDKGAIFLIEDDPDLLVMKGSYNLAEPLHEICKTVSFGTCLCGRAAQEDRVVFAGNVDHIHDISFDGMPDHGHYAVPVYTQDRKQCGVFTVYVEAGTRHSRQVEDFLVTAASILGIIIQHKQAEEKRKEIDEKYRAITNTANDAIIMMSAEGKTIFWNPAAASIFGYTEEEVLGKDLHDLIAPKEYHDLAHEGMEKFVKTGHGNLIGETQEVKGLRKDGTELPVELSLSSVSIGGKRSAVGIVRDISERKDAEEEKVKLLSQLRQAQKLEAIGTLAGGIAHDFNNILTSILGYADLVKDAVEDNPEATQDLNQVLDAAARARALVNQILTFSRQADHELIPIQISLIVKEALKLLRASIPTTIEIKLKINIEDTTVLADASHIHQIIMNMCANAFQAMKDGGVLEIILDDEQPEPEMLQTHPDMMGGSFLCLRISDTGCGMTQDIVSRIFEPYFSTRKKEDGTGLGLSVVHGIIANLGGAISVSSVVGTGTTFSIYLPRVAEEKPVEKAEISQVQTGSEHILYVDDELPIVNLGKRILESIGYEVTIRTSSIEALEAFRNHPERYDIVITDQTMPNMNGIAFARNILSIRNDIPVILCTGYDEFDVRNEIIGTGIRDVLVKPVSKENFAAKIREVLDGQGGAS